MDAVTSPPAPHNEPIKDYAPGSPERAELQAKLQELTDQGPIELPSTHVE